MKIKELFFLTFVFLIPIDGTDYLSIYIGPIHVSILDMILVVLFYLVFIEVAVTGHKISPLIQKILVLFMIAFIFSLISLLYISSNQIAYDLKITLNFLEFFVMFVVTSSIMKKIDFIKKTVFVLNLSMFVVSVLTVMKSLGVPIPGFTRATSVYAGPFLLGAAGFFQGVLTISCMMVGVFPFVLDDTIIKSRITRSIYLIIFLAVSAIVFSRGLWFAIAAQLIVFMSMKHYLSKGIFKKMLIGTAVFVIISINLFYWKEFSDSIVALRPSTFQDRIGGYKLGIELIFSSPLNFLLGAGKETFVSMSEKNAVPHNFILDLLVSKGIITTLIIMFIFMYLFIKLIQIIKMNNIADIIFKKRFASLSIVVLSGYFVIGMSTPIVNSLQFWLVVSIISSYIALVLNSEDISNRTITKEVYSEKYVSQ